MTSDPNVAPGEAEALETLAYMLGGGATSVAVRTTRVTAEAVRGKAGRMFTRSNVGRCPRRHGAELTSFRPSISAHAATPAVQNAAGGPGSVRPATRSTA